MECVSYKKEARSKNTFARSSRGRPREFKYSYKGGLPSIYLCKNTHKTLRNSDERVRNDKQKYMTEVQCENNEQFNYYTECVFR